jgi:adenylate cyclase
MAQKKDDQAGIGSKLKFLFHPAAIGIYWTLIWAGLIFSYYNVRDSGEDSGLILSVLKEIDQRSFDYRLRLRGPRPGSDQVAILAFDDESIDRIGRWPWPRQTTAQVFKNAVDAGVRSIATDIVFSEPEARPDEVLVERLKTRVALPQDVQTTLDEELARLAGDRIFGETLQTILPNVVLGNFYSSQRTSDKYAPGSGYVALCERMVFDLGRAAPVWEADGLPLVVAESNDMTLPNLIQDYYKAQLSEMPEEHRAPFCRERFLLPGKDEFAGNLAEQWNLIRENDPNLKFASFEEWSQDLRSTYLQNRVLQVDGWVTNLPGIYHDGSFNGFFNTVLEDDGTIRRTQLVARSGNHYVTSIALKSYLTTYNYIAQLEIGPTSEILGTKGAKSLIITDAEGNPKFRFPVEPNGTHLINYAGPQKMFPYVRAADLVDPNQTTVTVVRKVLDPDSDKWIEVIETLDKASFLKNKILVAGLTAIGVYDLRLSPFEENYPGVETHANVIDNLIRGDFLRFDNREPMIMVLTVLALGLILTVMLSHLGAVSAMIFAFISLGVIAWVDKSMFFSKGLVVSAAFPFLQVMTSYMILTFYKYLTEERSKRELRQTFSKYVSPAIVEEILQDPKNLQLGGRKERVTIFFSDVRGFTTISEKLDPQALSDLLNQYLTPMTDLVFANRGTLDKYMGDAIMAFFGAPISYPDHAKYAAKCALQQLEKLKVLQAQYAKKGLPLIDIGIGLNTGECSVGNMGSETVRNYTVMGDSVNLASRLEGINKEYGTHIIISEFTHAEIKDDFTCREVDWVRVKGKLLPVKIYELLGEGRPETKIDTMKKFYEDGYSLYREKRFEQAITAFEKAHQAVGEDQPSLIYIDRCRQFLLEPPPPNWDGVYVMKTK